MQSNKSHDPSKLDILIQVTAEAMAKLWLWVDLAKGEVSALGLVEEIFDEKSGSLWALRVTDFFLVSQNCSPTETTMEPQGVAQLLGELETAGLDSGKLLCWAHSHADMSVFWSGTDNENIEGLANGRYLLSLVVNKKRQSLMRLDMYHPAHLCVTDICWEVDYPLDEALQAEYTLQFKAKVQEEGSYFSKGVSSLMTNMFLDDLKEAHRNGQITEEELKEELSWMDEMDEVPV